jgi:hypothetical protein
MGFSGEYLMHGRKKTWIWMRRSEGRDYSEEVDEDWRTQEKFISK